MKAFGFGFKQFGWVGRGFERVAKIGQSHEPDCMFDVTVATHAEGGPAGIGNPAAPLGEMMLKEEVVNGTRKRNVDVSPEVDVTYFCLTEAIFPGREPVRMHGNPRPR